jgi:hypothetical protein
MAKDLRFKSEIKEGDHLIPFEDVVRYFIETGMSEKDAKEFAQRGSNLREKFLACKNRKEIFKLIREA